MLIQAISSTEEKYYKKKHLWSPGKFMGSVGHITLEKAKQYLEAHHAKRPVKGIPAFSRREKVARRAILQGWEDANLLIMI